MTATPTTTVATTATPTTTGLQDGDPARSAATAPGASATSTPRSLAGRIARVAGGLAAGLAVALAAGWWMGVRPAEVLRHASGVSPVRVGGCVLSGFVVFACQSLRWHQVMRPVLGLSYGQAYRAQVVGMMFNAILPARGGDLLRVQYLGRRSGKSRATILATEVVDRWLDWWGWFPVLLVIGLTGGVPRWIFTALGIFGAILATWAAVMVTLGRRGWTPRPGTRFGAVFAAFQTGIRAFASKRTLRIALLIAPLAWIWETAVIAWAARAFGIDLSLAMAFSVLVAFNASMVVPSPGAVGTVEAGGTAALVFFGVDPSRALAFMFVYHFSQLLPGIAAGVGILVAEGERLFGRTGARYDGAPR